MSKERNVKTIPIVGGHIALDLVNTIDGRNTDAPVDYLQDFSDLLAWAGRTGGVREKDLKSTEKVLKSKPRKALDILATTRDLRDCLQAVFIAQANGESPTESAVDTLNKFLSNAFESVRLEIDNDPHVALRFGDGLFWHLPNYIAFQGIALLTSPAAQDLKICDRGGCGWVFLDQSRKRNRKWCSMQDCGNVIKQRRHRMSVENCE